MCSSDLRRFFVFVLVSVVLAVYYDARRDVRDTHGAFSFIDMLPACAACAKDIDADILLFDIYLNIIIELGAYHHARKARMSAPRAIEWANAHQAMDAVFGFQISVGVLAAHDEANIFKTCFLALLKVQNLDLKALSLAKAQIHAV